MTYKVTFTIKTIPEQTKEGLLETVSKMFFLDKEVIEIEEVESEGCACEGRLKNAKHSKYDCSNEERGVSKI